MLDDDDAKIRRNLVVFSALVLFASFVGINPVAIVEGLSKSVNPIDPVKIWVSMLIVLIYLALRYRDAKLDVDKNYAEVLSLAYAPIKSAAMHQYVQFVLNCYPLIGDRTSIFGGSLEEHLRMHFEGNESPPDFRKLRIRVAPEVVHKGSEEFAARKFLASHADHVRYGLSMKWPGGVSSGGNLLKAHLGGVHRFIVTAYSRVIWFIWCEAAIRARVPVLLGLAAAIVLAEKIVIRLTTGE